MQNNENELGSFLAGFVIGALVGAATALILAPQSGEATRHKIASTSSELRSSADLHTRDYRDRASSILSDTRSKAQNLTDQVQEQVRIVLDAGKEQTEQIAENLSNGELTAKD